MATPTNNYNTIVGSPMPTATTAATTTTVTPTQKELNIEDLQLFPSILDIISRIKDDEIDLIRAINLANETRTKTIETLNKLPGINRSLENQEELLKTYKQTLKKKVELLEKLKKLEIFEKYNKIKSTSSQSPQIQSKLELQTELSQTEPSQTEPSQTEPSQTEPSQTESSQIESSQIESSQTETEKSKETTEDIMKE
ncbi:hypothetical protein DDB_G0287019 [Dictyostelium discoideum AX4]|uniref:Putative mediator of RNA polymerase II transcription subunit 9 n=1 Tax=Dictyostelium discoideum TaxID=44689 RepID=MED9_DICDI|nr:hypothetical protein DDB_G0287019 [Dictyostelium discoideum AX4]Q54KY8.1 RecName: Full=Putative mediator of RNA polymerase II transcription subunit 9; AltName: Full=Putative mediator complex subunit 9 [Dictyostelium discoideum]EAL63936.1 hypothetical protein DDB_G0287019 [Dictyostelium discoideum AX4]|eukprot:XP_637444.1 hypothetical protein DDB_G0287019 [Dictyostelium discoideum AX4]